MKQLNADEHLRKARNRNVWGFTIHAQRKAKRHLAAAQVAAIREQGERETGFPAGYYADPQKQADLRLWDGEKWTETTATIDRWRELQPGGKGDRDEG